MSEHVRVLLPPPIGWCFVWFRRVVAGVSYGFVVVVGLLGLGGKKQKNVFFPLSGRVPCGLRLIWWTVGPSKRLSCGCVGGLVIQCVATGCLLDLSMWMRVPGTCEYVRVRLQPPIETVRGVVLLGLVVFRFVAGG